MCEILADHITTNRVSSVDLNPDPYLNRTIWWCFEGGYYRGVIVSKELDEGGNLLYHVQYADGDETDLDMNE